MGNLRPRHGTALKTDVFYIRIPGYRTLPPAWISPTALLVTNETSGHVIGSVFFLLVGLMDLIPDFLVIPRTQTSCGKALRSRQRYTIRSLVFDASTVFLKSEISDLVLDLQRLCELLGPRSLSLL